MQVVQTISCFVYIADEVNSSATAVAKVSARCLTNERALVSRLPCELLEEVFWNLIDEKRGSARCIVPSQVCHLWRDVALGSPRLWTRILANNISQDELSTFLARSNSMPISVVLTDGLWDFVSRVDCQTSTVVTLCERIVSDGDSDSDSHEYSDGDSDSDSDDYSDDDSDDEEIDKNLRKFPGASAERSTKFQALLSLLLLHLHRVRDLHIYKTSRSAEAFEDHQIYDQVLTAATETKVPHLQRLAITLSNYNPGFDSPTTPLLKTEFHYRHPVSALQSIKAQNTFLRYITEQMNPTMIALHMKEVAYGVGEPFGFLPPPFAQFLAQLRTMSSLQTLVLLHSLTYSDYLYDGQDEYQFYDGLCIELPHLKHLHLRDVSVPNLTAFLRCLRYPPNAHAFVLSR